MGAKEIVALRASYGVSQAVFARPLNVPKVTAISWEKGRRKPTGAALRLLDLARKKPSILQEAQTEQAWPKTCIAQLPVHSLDRGPTSPALRRQSDGVK
ncbi:MAG TPA: hypothetical protein VGR78_16480 [Verrucomicrobiae bacterium]|jgi:DNA-binding XRE family transcriptional regulator|nr:hypothetical protein [Verrucomicrobiae bacterium]